MLTIRRHLMPLAAAVFALAALTLHAEESTFSASLDGKSNIPDPIATSASGKLKLVLAADGRSIRYELVVENLGNAASADLHVGPASANGPLVVKLFPVGDAAAKKGPFSGVLAQGTFTACNLHTNDGADPPNSGPGDYRLGEIRGQIH